MQKTLEKEPLNNLQKEIFPRSGFGRRFASWIYDALVVIAFSMLTTIIFLFVVQGLISLDYLTLNSAIDVSDYIEKSPILEGIRTALLIIVNCAFFVYFWTKGGQTIGMRSWRLKVQNLDGSKITIIQAFIRAITSLFGLGNLLVILDFKNKRALQDYIAKTEVVTLTKAENKRIYKSV
ncbi:RDD family protein [Pseudoalteromonas denitrificans]|uniref:Uncharacterized membrane protein YckC, RDD family n=1 Tax=Pseudoalteromonas denitrificans DSM 6059 TaxID=1123010 RepID=A0A1I1HBU5_9GAMM|nr:RDD family protein [Pseudoalteromonas denitrificans]SFC21424.1 Uncharacterized membrane protein YckC, RDD family [Pseudoalteromonas denitrificans DSM 6059]